MGACEIAGGEFAIEFFDGAFRGTSGTGADGRLDVGDGFGRSFGKCVEGGALGFWGNVSQRLVADVIDEFL